MGPMWPALSARFGVHPWDVERLTYAELEHYRDALVEEARARRKTRTRRR